MSVHIHIINLGSLTKIEHLDPIVSHFSTHNTEGHSYLDKLLLLETTLHTITESWIVSNNGVLDHILQQPISNNPYEMLKKHMFMLYEHNIIEITPERVTVLDLYVLNANLHIVLTVS